VPRRAGGIAGAKLSTARGLSEEDPVAWDVSRPAWLLGVAGEETWSGLLATCVSSAASSHCRARGLA
jgi:hypothetical protein